MSLIELRSVACVRGGRLLFEGLDLALGAGDAALVAGPNGAGKTSLIRIAAGLLPASRGSVERSGPAALADEALALDPKLELAAALAFWARRHGGDPAEAMAAMGLSNLARMPVRMLSTGQRKRAALARLVASRAPLWLLDEPANGLDPDGQALLEAAIAAHRSGGGAIIAASHQPLALPGAARVALG